jgi:hypothetical protein
MPMVMGLERLHKAGPLEAFLPVPFLKQPGLAKNSPGAAGADGATISWSSSMNVNRRYPLYLTWENEKF